jgi:lysozyme
MINVVRMLTIDEGNRYRVYLDVKGKHTIGIGFNMDDINSKAVWAQANILESFDNVYKNLVPLSVKSVGDLFNTCVGNVKYDLRTIFHDFDTYPEYVQLALVNLMFNMGKTKFSDFTETIAIITNKQFNEAADHLQYTLWAKQLPARSLRVRKLLKGDDSGYAL